MKMTIFDYIGDTEIFIHGTYHPGKPGKMYLRNGDPGYPSEPAEFEIHSIAAGSPKGPCIYEALWGMYTKRGDGLYISCMDDIMDTALEKALDIYQAAQYDYC